MFPKHAETALGGIPKRAINNPRAMESLASADLAIQGTRGDTIDTQRLFGDTQKAINKGAKEAVDRYGVHKTKDIARMAKSLKAAQEKMNSDARSIGQIMENSDISTGIGREEYLRAVNRSEMGKNEYRTARSTYLDAIKANNGSLEREDARLLDRQERGYGYLERKTDTGGSISIERERGNILAASLKINAELKKSERKYPPV